MSLAKFKITVCPLECARSFNSISNAAQLRDLAAVLPYWRDAATTPVPYCMDYAVACDMIRNVTLTGEVAEPLCRAFNRIDSHDRVGKALCRSVATVTGATAVLSAAGITSMLGLAAATAYAVVVAKTLNDDLNEGRALPLMKEATALKGMGYRCEQTWPRGGRLIQSGL